MSNKTRVTVDAPYAELDGYFEGDLVHLDEDREILVMRTDEGELVKVNLNVLTLEYGPDNSLYVC